MQLILNTDTDIGVQKMSTFQQESLDEKFISNNLMEKVCSDIADMTNGNDVCVKTNEVEKVFEKNVSVDEQLSPIKKGTNNKIISDEKNFLEYKLNEICDKDLAENKGNSELDTVANKNCELDTEAKDNSRLDAEANSQFDHDKLLQGQTCLDIDNYSSVPHKEKEIEDNENEDDISMEEGKNICKLENKIHNDNCAQEDKLENVGEAIIALEDKITGQDKTSVIENKLEDQSKVNCAQETRLEERNKLTIGLEDKINDRNISCEIENESEKQLEAKSIEKNKEKEPCEMKNKHKLIIEAHKEKEQSHDHSDIEDKECSDKESCESKDIFKELVSVEAAEEDNFVEHDHNNSKVDDKIEENRNSGRTENITEELDEGCNEDSVINQIENNEPTLTANCEPDVMKSVDDSTDNLDKTSYTPTEKISEVKEHIEITEIEVEDCESETNVDDKKIILHIEPKSPQDNDKVENVLNNNSETKTATELQSSGVIIDIVDEKDEESESITSENKHIIEKDVNNINERQESDDQEMITISESPKSTILTDSLEEKVKKLEKTTEDKKKLTHICRLSNTLDILSDEDDDTPQEETEKDLSATDEKQCIDIYDDDEIMVIDEESNPQDSKNKNESVAEQGNKARQNEECKADIKDNDEKSVEIPINQTDTVITKEDAASDIEMKNEPEEIVPKSDENIIQRKPLLPENFLKTCKKNLADMTRDELEEFCILKIVESVVDRSDLSEIKSQLKSMAQNIEEYRKKASILAKQNRDLQVVLKSVQEEQKKKSNLPITPLKITRSVGMQVLMTDKSGIRRKPSQGPNTPQNSLVSNSPSNRSVKGQVNQNLKLQKIQPSTNMSPIPVPRLVPAVNNANLNNVKIQPPNVMPAKVQAAQVTTSVPNAPIQSVSNGLPTLTPAPKPEKRPHSRMQQNNNSVTVDLTDDEPPAKLVQRNNTPPVRLVSPQNLLASHRQPFGTNINIPRKVFIPISGSQGQGVGVRPGQTIMVKTISPQGPRQRCQSPAVGKSIISPPTNTVRMQRIPSRHPAPLPDSMKQYQPPNWKALPPAPELKLSKVENGIVISWKIDGYQEENYEEIASYQLYAYQETSSPPNTALWKKIGDVKALPLPMACTLTQFMAGYKYYFAVRAVDIRSRLGPFSLPGSILLLNKM